MDIITTTGITNPEENYNQPGRIRVYRKKRWEKILSSLEWKVLMSYLERKILPGNIAGLKASCQIN